MITMKEPMNKVIEHLKVVHFKPKPKNFIGKWVMRNYHAPDGVTSELIKLVRFFTIIPDANLLIDRQDSFFTRLSIGKGLDHITEFISTLLFK